MRSRDDLAYEQIRVFQAEAEAVRRMWLSSVTIRNEFGYTHLTGEWRVGQALAREEKANGGQPYQGSTRNPELQVDATIAEKVGNRMMGWRLQTVAPLGIQALESFIDEYHQREKQATLTGIVKSIRAGESELRRLDSMTAPTLYAPVFREGDCRVASSDIEPGSIPLIMTDPPYEDGAEPLWRWLGQWAADVLIDGVIDRDPDELLASMLPHMKATVRRLAHI
jgi:hypothetical protein